MYLGAWNVILYAWTPAAPDILTGVEPDCEFGEAAQIGGPWPGQLTEGVTHLRHTTTVTDGTLRLCTAGGLTFEGALNGVQLALVESFDHAAILGQKPGVMNADPAAEKTPQFRSRALRPIVFVQFLHQFRLLPGGQQRFALELFGGFPATVAIEAENQRGRQPRLLVVRGGLSMCR